MADYMNPDTKEIKFSVDIPDQGWIPIPRKMATVLLTVPRQYIVIENGEPRQMSSEEKGAYDTAHPVSPRPKMSNEILDGIWDGITTPEQGLRLNNALAKWPFFIIHLESGSFDKALEVIQMAVANGDAIQADYDMIKNIINS